MRFHKAAKMPDCKTTAFFFAVLYKDKFQNIEHNDSTDEEYIIILKWLFCKTVNLVISNVMLNTNQVKSSQTTSLLYM